MRLHPSTEISVLFLSIVAASLCGHPAFAEDPKNADWREYLGGKSRSLFSPLKQITREDVAKLEVAWTFDTGEKGEYQANNLIVDGGRSGRPSGGSLVAFALPR